MDLSAQSYRTILRSHSDAIKQIEAHEATNSVITLSNGSFYLIDFTIRIWEAQTFEQLYEFSYPKDDLCMIIAVHPA